MRKKVIFCILLLTFPSFAQAEIKIKIGWQIPWTLQGQLVQVLKHTDILKKNGIEAEFIGRTFGPELNELALANAVDLILTADQPAAILFSKSKDWVGIGRLMYNRTSTYVPVASPIAGMKDLRGKVIGLPVGAAAERTFYSGLNEAGLKKEDVTVLNLGILEQSPLIKRAKTGAKKWGQFDALAGFDPLPAMFETNGQARMIHTGKVCSLIILNKNILKKGKTVPAAILKSFRDAYLYYRDHKEQADSWFLAEAKMELKNTKALRIAESLEPNLKNQTPSLSFSESDFKILQDAADFVKKASGESVNMKQFVTNDYSLK